MKAFKAMLGLAAVGVGLWAGAARAQFGLPIVESYEGRETGILDFTAGATFSEENRFYGLRDTISVLEDFRLFIDLGLADIERNDENLAVQGGFIWCLPLDTPPVDLGLRGSAYWFNGDVDEISGYTAMLMASGNPVFEGLYVYGGLGFDYRTTETDLIALGLEQPGKTEKSDDKIRAVTALGALMPVTERFWIFAEALVNDDPYIAVGIRTR